jgi:hypothetical protein
VVGRNFRSPPSRRMSASPCAPTAHHRAGARKARLEEGGCRRGRSSQNARAGGREHEAELADRRVREHL